ncbi:MAG: Cyclic di-GMP phosphodiesterase CdgJ [Xylophilus sp.]|nr:MAG: Cyclic di-GMP phosphodiesterase CdgJ [Xylophilus sp.]
MSLPPAPLPFGPAPGASPAGGIGGAVIARQAIVNAQHAVIGYELFNRSMQADTHTAASDVALVFSALSHAGTEDLIGKLLIFVNCTHNSLMGGHLELINPDRVVLEIPPLDTLAPEEIEGRVQPLAALRQRGFQLAFNHTVLHRAYRPWLPLADYIKIDLALVRPEQIEAVVRHAQTHSQAELIAEKVETAAQFETVSRQGVQLFQGYWFARPSVVEARLVTPSQAATIQLVNLVRRQASTAEIEDVLKHDAGLAFNLMRLINSSGFGFAREVTSFRQAVMILGLKKLFRWAALLLTAARASGAPSSVGSTAVVRGRLMELLALQKLSAEEADNAFVVGIFSLLDTMLGMPMDKAVDLLALPRPVEDALLRQEGPYAPFLELTIACETGDDAAFTRAATALGLDSRQINGAHLQALAWADQLASSS